jgi:hypothetical protein
MASDPKPAYSGQATLTGVAVGTILGIILDKLAIGIVFGYFIGTVIDSSRRKQQAAREAETRDDATSV